MTVTIIIPIYNVSSYIERCARSLYEQTYRDIEYIWVNDATLDNSLEILKNVTEEYPSRKLQTQIITHKQNKGLPSARNTGLKYSSGDYVFHCDSDDYVDKEMVSTFVRKAIDTNADIVYSDWYLSFSKNERYMVQPMCETPLQCVEAMLSGSMRFNVWNKLIRRSLYVDNKIVFPDGYGMGEDMTMIKLFASAAKIAYLPKAYYHYMQINPQAYTKVFSERHWNELCHNVANLKEFVETKYGTLFYKHLHFFCLNVKLPLLISGDSRQYEYWLACFNESNRFIDKNDHVSYRTRWLQRMALQRRFWLIRLHYYVIIRFVYGVIYR